MAEIRLTHVGGPTLLVEAAGLRILTDPTFDPPGRRYSFGWGTSSRKLVGPALAATDLGRIDAVLLTHDHHADNLDDAGRALLDGVPTVLTTEPGARRLGGAARGLEPWATTRLGAVTVTATPCRHGPPLSRPVAGAVIGFALDLGGRTLWISGDTVLYRGIHEVARRIRVDVAVVHLGCVRFPLTGPLHYSLTADEAVATCRLVRPDVVVPVHYEGWSHFREGRAEAERAFAAAGLTETVRWPVPGEPLVV
ncbi:MBL fold metallo-hydrolase [Pseudonocardia sp. WMMC193]|uniref:MBL fold metallo-hydrolase n=1 Tax=Pseudonocardia sp. WMMC193 TaxID=2911965 RepID=UPI001F45E2EC|nr:MBL fold metallo-hydrolase [Pseudonocardia sp. WMMC193]MCF7551258.1 MBL fold metallo-hydrolase [Pseudonocardia sp. WMMC193]